MISSASSVNRGDGRLWVIALGLSLLVNTVILGFVGFAAMKAEILRRNQPHPATPAPSVTTVTIFPDMIAAASAPASPPAATPPPAKPEFVRTSEDQLAAKPPETRAFIGERNTEATSDRAPDVTAPALPSQKGIEKDHQDLETTESDYQDGSLSGSQAAKKPQEAMPTPPSPPAPLSDPALAENPVSGEKMEHPGNDDTKSSPPPAGQLLNGPNPVDVPIPKAVAEKSEIKPTPPKRPKDGAPSPKATDAPKPAVAQSSNDPAFRGYQRKAAIVGSISRNGRSALDVADSPLGRYQAAISRAVELEWQRNCVRHRDFITPGFLTVRFYVETSGKVRTVQFVGQMETGEVQKGFTLSSIRDAEIPAMPPAVKKEFEKEPLELIFNFYF